MTSLAGLLLASLLGMSPAAALEGPPPPPPRPAELAPAEVQIPTAHTPPTPEQINDPQGMVIRPWQAWTPGAVRRATKEEICSTGTAEIRKSLRSSTKRAVGRRYRVAKGGAFVYDHLVPLGVGGAPDDPNNLWPEPRGQAKTKDVCENRARAMVCSRQTLTLEEAQKGFATDFVKFCESIGVPQRADAPAKASETAQ